MKRSRYTHKKELRRKPEKVVPMLYHKNKTPVNTEVFKHSRDPKGRKI